MLELSNGRSKYIPEILYVYNMETPYNDNKVNAALQVKIEKLIRAQEPYKPLKKVPYQYSSRR
jgi:hypothetical protein